MTQDDIQDIPGYLSVKEAAALLHISLPRMYEHVRDRRVALRKVGKTYLIPTEAVKSFKPNLPGRRRTTPPNWRVYRGGSHVLTTEIVVQIQDDRYEALLEMLQEIREEKRHTFRGTIARYVLINEDATIAKIWLVWKDTEMPDETTRQKELDAFKTEFADVLNWETAQYSNDEGIIYT